jgi:hypothetical protein
MRHRFDIAASTDVIDHWMVAAGNRRATA